MTTFSAKFLEESSALIKALDTTAIESLAEGLAAARADGGRLFILGVGGSAGHASHAVNDFRKLCGIEAYSATDNVAELTARVNDDGWETVFESYLKTSRAAEPDAVFILSVGGGDIARKISVGLIRAIEYAKSQRVKVYGIVGRENCYTKQAGDEVIVIPVPEPALLTPLAEAFQAVVCHAIVSDPRLAIHATTW